MKPSEIMFDKTISNRDKFGVYVRGRRNELDMTLRDFANDINLSPAYVSDIENGNRYAPMNYLKQVARILQIEKEEINYFYDLAGCSHSNWTDINDYLSQMPSARKAIRMARDKNMTEEEFVELISSIDREKENYKELER